MQIRYWLLALCITVASLMCLVDPSGELRLKVDPSTESLIDNKKVRTGKTSELMVVIRRDMAWTGEAVLAVGDLLARVRQLPAVVSIESAVTARLPHVTVENIDIASLEDRIVKNPEAAGDWIRWTFDEPLIQGRLVNENFNDLGVRIRLSRVSVHPQAEVLQRVLNVLEAYDAEQEDLKIYITGTPVVDRDISQILVTDLGRILLLSALAVPVVLGLAFSSLAAVVLPLLTVVIALIWSLAAMVLLGIPINLVTAVVPPLVIGLTLAYAMHAMFGVIHQQSRGQATRLLVLPFLATGLTTIAGFLALYLQPVPAIRQFSLAGASSVAAALLAIILLLCLGSPGWLSKVRTRGWLDACFGHLTDKALALVKQKRGRVLLLAFLVFLLSLMAASTVTPGARFMSDLPDNHPTRVNFEVINTSLGGGNGFRIIIDGGAEDSVLLPGVLREVESLQQWLDAQPEVGKTTSLVDYIKRFSQIFQGGRAEAYTIPDNIFLSKQLLVIASSSEAERYTNLSNSMLAIQVQTHLDETAQLAGLINRLEARLKTLPSNLKVHTEGEAVTLVRTIEQLTTGQVKSLALAILAIYLVISLLFSSLRMGFWAMLPNLLPIAVFYGLIGITGTHLSPTMALVSCLVIGIAVDDTMFYLVRFGQAARNLASEKKGAEQALRETLKPVTLTTVVLCLCFLTFVTGQFDSQAMFGILAATTLLVAWVCDLTLTPAVGARSSIVTLWDVLNVDLGSNPQQTIPLMRDMSLRQARMFALLTRMQTIPAGECFIHRGDSTRNIYVILKGRARVWGEHDGVDIELTHCERGAIIGEISVFLNHRTANVTAETELQVLVFDPARLDRIRRRHPRIAALVYKNLNRIQAERLEHTTHELEALMAGVRAGQDGSGQEKTVYIL